MGPRAELEAVGRGRGRDREQETHLLPLPAIKPRPSSPYSVAIPTELSQFLAWKKNFEKYATFVHDISFFLLFFCRKKNNYLAVARNFYVAVGFMALINEQLGK
jgi:hypothetical protein